jgi:hypothetical protein
MKICWKIPRAVSFRPTPGRVTAQVPLARLFLADGATALKELASER